jgi:signal peptidase II
MKNETNKKIIIGILIIFFIFILDRITKILILNIAEETGEVDIYINSFFNLYLVWNKGIGFGLLSFDQEHIYNSITILIILINFIIIYLIYLEKGIKTYFLLAILGGSLGNLFDRIYYNAVPDFMDLNYKGFHWFIFNVADIFITLGIICLILAEIINYKKKINEKKY